MEKRTVFLSRSPSPWLWATFASSATPGSCLVGGVAFEADLPDTDSCFANASPDPSMLGMQKRIPEKHRGTSDGPTIRAEA